MQQQSFRVGLAAVAVTFLMLAFSVFSGGCSYTPTKEDFTNPPDWLDRTTEPPTLWYRDTTDQGHEYLYAYHPKGLDVCDGRAGCTMPDGRSVVLAPWWYWRGKAAFRTHTIRHEECHVDAIQSGQRDRCET